MEFRKQIEMMFREKQSPAPGGMGGASGSGRSRLPVNHFVCNFEGCGATIKHRRNLVRHWQLHQKAKYFCARCGQLFPSRELITQHDCDRSEQRFHCDQCEKRFSALQHLNRHLLLMHGQRLFVWCPTCRSYFARIDALKKHQSRCHSLSSNSAVSGLASLGSSGNNALIGSSAAAIAGFDLGGRGFADLSGQAAAVAAAAAASAVVNHPMTNVSGSSSASIANVTNAIGSLGQSVITSTGIGHGSSLLHNSVQISSSSGSSSINSNVNVNSSNSMDNRSRAAAAAAAAAGNFGLGSNELLNMVKNVDSVRNALMGAAAGAPNFNNPSGASMMSDYSQNNLFGNLITDRKLVKQQQAAMFSFANMDTQDDGGRIVNSAQVPTTSGSSNAGFCAGNLLLGNYNKLNDNNQNARTKKTKMDLVGALF
jgi:hypothetical protein